jgi:hypothetical protein
MTFVKLRTRVSGGCTVVPLCGELQKGGDVLLAAPRGPMLRLLAVLGVAGVYASVAAVAGSAGRPAPRRRVLSIVRFRGATAGAWYWWAMHAWQAPDTSPHHPPGRPGRRQLARWRLRRRSAGC